MAVYLKNPRALKSNEPSLSPSTLKRSRFEVFPELHTHTTTVVLALANNHLPTTETVPVELIVRPPGAAPVLGKRNRDPVVADIFDGDDANAAAAADAGQRPPMQSLLTLCMKSIQRDPMRFTHRVLVTHLDPFYVDLVERRHFYTNDALRGIYYISDGKLDGPMTKWHAFGKSEDHYKNDCRDGVSTSWNLDGQITGQSVWKKGKMLYRENVGEKYVSAEWAKDEVGDITKMRAMLKNKRGEDDEDEDEDHGRPVKKLRFVTNQGLDEFE